MSSLYFSELNKLRNSQKQLEKYQMTVFDQLTRTQNLNTDFHSLMQCYQNTSDKSEIQEIVDSLKYIKRAVVLEGGKNVPDLELFQEDLIDLLNRIQNLRIQSKKSVDELLLVQSQLNEDVEQYTERLSIWTEPVRVDSHKNEVPSRIDTSCNDLPNDVKAFMHFIKISKGHENGWLPQDHHLFLKLRKKYKDLNELFLKLHEILPDIKLEDVTKHEAWYIKYKNLKEKHNEAIKQWQKLKNSVQYTNFGSVDEIQHLENKPGRAITSTQRNSEEKKKIREDIESWKKEQEKLKSIEQNTKLQEAERMKMKDEERRRENQIRKEFIQKWKCEKLALEEQKKKNEETRNMIEQQIRASVANKMIKHYQMRDKEFSDKHIKKEDKKSFNIIPKSISQMERNPERLFRPTKQWIHRFLASGENYPVKEVCFIGRIPKLQTPQWRRNFL